MIQPLVLLVDSPEKHLLISKGVLGVSLVARRWRIRLPMHKWVWPLTWGDPACCRATKPHVSQLLSLCSRARGPQLLKPECPRARAPQQERPQQEACASQLERSPLSLQLDESPSSNEEPAQSVHKYTNRCLSWNQVPNTPTEILVMHPCVTFSSLSHSSHSPTP